MLFRPPDVSLSSSRIMDSCEYLHTGGLAPVVVLAGPVSALSPAKTVLKAGFGAVGRAVRGEM